ncbi:glycosyltransferase family 2 protein [Roseomonas sp. SSH11]|uniref:Glycosyltransferase family 2 protein n=1 Tax=Pararoseomonas baculiformis TaxID=2820812 RepID=A0ABS4A987_9PROT|nr:glycosyltransferase family 2 protein [Pararoseomonas baculiformis]MBP0443441.1 glycosyltransferase family 2 protein [Pararoseomonas baculiformis]
MSPPATSPGNPAEGTTPPGHPAISVVVPVRNEAPNIASLVAEIGAALAGVPHEIIYVDDGSTDGTAGAVRGAAASAPVRLLRHAVSCGQSAAIVTGIRAARAPWIATLDGDGQNDPADIPRLWERARAEGADTLVAGWRTTRKDTATKRFTSRIANRVRARLLGDATPDTGCGLKVFPRDLFLALPHFDHMHRFLPALVLRGGGRVVSEPVGHRPRMRGVSNYGTLDRLAVGIVDLLGIMWLQRRWKRPRLLPDSANAP